jgi:hypothetical protein
MENSTSLIEKEKPVELVRTEDFMRQTMGGWPCQMECSIYAGLPFECACGKVHIFDPAITEVLRELSWMRLVLGCPDSESITCVKLKGFFRVRFESLFGARA